MPPPIKGRTKALIGTHYIDRGEFFAGRLRGNIRDWQIKCVCGGDDQTCNNGWMRKLVDEKASPILSRLIQGDEVRITSLQQQYIASWAALKCMIAEYGWGGVVTTHHTQRKRMRRLQLPPANGWGIWIGSCNPNTSNLAWKASPFPMGSPDDLRRVRYNSQTSTLRIKKLFVQVQRAPDARMIDWNFDLLDGGGLFRIWPPTSWSISWPGKTLSAREVELISTSLERAILAAAKKAGR